jgi:hypothetical protein
VTPIGSFIPPVTESLMSASSNDLMLRQQHMAAARLACEGATASCGRHGIL